MTTTLLIARHGNTFDSGDVILRVGARTDLPLSSSGVEQAKKLGLYLREHAIMPDLVFTSELKRAKETAAYALTEAGYDAKPETRRVFNEVDYGVDEGLPEDDVVARLGKDALRAWEDDSVVPDGWLADPAAMRQGWLDFGAEILRDHAGKTILVVTSNGVARFAPALTGDEAGFRARYKPKIATGGLCVLAHDGGAWRISDWNIRP
ncbi:MAG: histidine phosphatase family protein [Alphaproteobacteria bacterium]